MELEAERRRSEQMIWTLLQEKEALQSEKEQLLRAGAAVLGATALVGAGVLALFRRRHTIAIDALRLAAAVSQSRSLAETERARRFGAEPLAKSLVPVCDNIDALCASLRGANGVSPFLLEGADLTASSLSHALSKNSVSKLSPAVGAKFDPHLHEAVFTAPLAAGGTPGAIQSVLRPGYTLHETRLIRPAQVGVFSSHPPAGVSAEAAPDPPSRDTPGATPDRPPQDGIAAPGRSTQSAAADLNPSPPRSETSTQAAPESGAAAERVRPSETRGQAPPTASGSPSFAPVATPAASATVAAARADAQPRPTGSTAQPSVPQPDAEQQRGIAIEKMLMQSIGFGPPPRPPATDTPTSPDDINAPVLSPRERTGGAVVPGGGDEAAGLTGEDLHELLVLHARQPERWGAPELAARFGVDEQSVAATLQFCAAYRVVPEEDEGSGMGVAEPIMPDQAPQPPSPKGMLAGSSRAGAA
jgi:molecular chaperone GrpE